MGSFAINLKTARIKAGFTQIALAEKLGMTRQNYSRYENEVINAQPSLELLCDLAATLNTDVNTLVGFDPDERNSVLTFLRTANVKFAEDPIFKNQIYILLPHKNTYCLDVDELKVIIDATQKKLSELTAPIFKDYFGEMLMDFLFPPDWKAKFDNDKSLTEHYKKRYNREPGKLMLIGEFEKRLKEFFIEKTKLPQGYLED